MDATKPIFSIEYCDAGQALGSPTQDPACFCPRALALGMTTSIKRAALDAPGVTCEAYCATHKCAPAGGTGSCAAKKANTCGAVGLG